jgi:hypothetical protein
MCFEWRQGSALVGGMRVLVVELSELTAPRWGLLGWKRGDTASQGCEASSNDES